MSCRKINYTKEEASSLYCQSYRYKIINELKIEKIQNDIKNKINKSTEQDTVDLIFDTKKYSGVDICNMSQLLTLDSGMSHFTSARNGDMEKQNNVHNTHSDSIYSQKCSNTPDKRHSTSDEQNIDRYMHHATLDNIKHQKPQNKLISKYIDMEADCSSESEMSTEHDVDLEMDFIDNSTNLEESNLYYEEKSIENQKILRRLKKRFKKVKRKHANVEIVKSDDEDGNSGDSDVSMDIGEINFEVGDVAMLTEEIQEQKTESISFNNLNEVQKINDEKQKAFKFKKL